LVTAVRGPDDYDGGDDPTLAFRGVEETVRKRCLDEGCTAALFNIISQYVIVPSPNNFPILQELCQSFLQMALPSAFARLDDVQTTITRTLNAVMGMLKKKKSTFLEITTLMPSFSCTALWLSR
jgi:hypothetical protein